MALAAPTAKVLPVSPWTRAAMIVLESTAAAPPWKKIPAADMRQNRLLTSGSSNGVSFGQVQLIEGDAAAPQGERADEGDRHHEHEVGI